MRHAYSTTRKGPTHNAVSYSSHFLLVALSDAGFVGSCGLSLDHTSQKTDKKIDFNLLKLIKILGRPRRAICFPPRDVIARLKGDHLRQPRSLVFNLCTV
uniref:Transposase n=1 Tax=Steinernema glaseri TaxID=37863 RepID=A0A1I7YWH7_9BILA